MIEFYVCEIRDLIRDFAKALVSRDFGTAMEHTEQEYLASTFAEKLADKARIFVIDWEGEPTPFGANIGGWIIHSYAHGMVRFCNGDPHAVCQVLKKNCGAKGRVQQMIVYLYAEDKPPSNLPAPRSQLLDKEPDAGLRVYSMTELTYLKLDGTYIIKIKDPDCDV
jgi:hypothetical protein